jgi:hypothetical protein
LKLKNKKKSQRTMIFLFLLLLALGFSRAQQQCAAGSTNLFAMSASATSVVSSVACMGQQNGATATAVQVGKLCDTCTGGCETNTRLCFRAVPLVFSFQFRVPVRFDAAIAWVTLRAVQRITALTITGQELLGQQTFAAGVKMSGNDFYSVARAPGAPAAISSLQVQIFAAGDQTAISRLLICGSVVPMSSVPGSTLPTLTPGAFVTPSPVNRPEETPSVLTIFVPPDETSSGELALPLSVIIGISAAAVLCVLFVCFAVWMVARARRIARREANMTFGTDVTPSRNRPAQRTPGYSPSNLFERFRRTPVPPDDDHDGKNYITMQPVPPHYKTMEMETNNDAKGSYDHVPEVDQGYGYTSDGPHVTESPLAQKHSDNYDIAATAPYSTAADKPKF